MVLRGNPISKTKKFFRNTIKSFKSFLSGGYQYQRLSKTPPFNPFSCNSSIDSRLLHQSSRDFDKFYADLTNHYQWADSGQEKGAMKKSSKETMATTNEPAVKEEDVCSGRSFMKLANSSPIKSRKEERREEQTKFRRAQEGQKQGTKPCSATLGKGRSYLVVQKLRELEMMDRNNVDHVLDMEEVIHYYSRLTCPAYLDIVDKFFMDMYSEILTPQTFSGNELRSRIR